MMARRAYFIWIMVAYVCVTYASPSFYTQRLKCIAQAVGMQLPDTLQPGKEYAGSWTFKQRPLRVRTNAFGDVSHIGYCLFDERMYNHYEHKVVLDFVLNRNSRMGLEDMGSIEVGCSSSDLALNERGKGDAYL